VFISDEYFRGGGQIGYDCDNGTLSKADIADIVAILFCYILTFIHHEGRQIHKIQTDHSIGHRNTDRQTDIYTHMSRDSLCPSLVPAMSWRHVVAFSVYQFWTNKSVKC